MTQIKVDDISDAAGTGAPDFADGLTVAGSAISTLNTAEYYSSATEPSSPKNGAIWWDSANDKVMVYVAGEWKEVELGASAGGGWSVDLSNVTYDSVSFSVASQETLPANVGFNTDGTKMYLLGFGSDALHQYTLSTAFDISTASYDSVSFSVASQDSTPFNFAFNPDGTKLYVVGYGSDAVYQYTLSTGFDLSTASYDSVSFSITGQLGDPFAIAFNTDGTKMYLSGTSSSFLGTIYQYSLSTAFDLSTISYDSVTFSVHSQQQNPHAISFNPDGTKLYTGGRSPNGVHQYSLSTAFDLSTISYDSVTFSLASQETSVRGIRFSSDGTKLYAVGTDNDTVYQYSTGL